MATIRRCRDPKDDKFLELAVDGNADRMITGNKNLPQLSPFQSASILNPSAAGYRILMNACAAFASRA
jgi:uncharacterized protein